MYKIKKLKKMGKIMLVMAILSLMLCACGSKGNTNSDTANKNPMLLEVEYSPISGSGYGIYVDVETGVEYVFSYRGGFTPLYKADGTLKCLSPEEIEVYRNK